MEETGGVQATTAQSDNFLFDRQDLQQYPSKNKQDETVEEDEDKGDFSVWDATLLLTSRAIGTGFLYFPSH